MTKYPVNKKHVYYYDTDYAIVVASLPRQCNRGNVLANFKSLGYLYKEINGHALFAHLAHCQGVDHQPKYARKET